MRDINSSDTLCVNIQTAARMLGISRNTAYLMARLKQLPTIKCGQRRLVVPKASLLKMMGESEK